MSVLQNHGECVQELQKVLDQLEALRSLAIDMGRVIRCFDESSEHSEFWTQDGDYIIDGRFPK